MISKLRLKKKKTLVLLVIFTTTLIAQVIAGQLLNTFNAGEVSPNIKYRLDLQQYAASCQTLENMIVIPQGAAIRRPGTEYIATTKNSSQARLLPFEYSTEDSYVLEFGDEYIRFYADGGQIMSGTGIEDFSALTMSADVLASWRLNDNADNTNVEETNGTYTGTSDNNTEDMHWPGKAGTGCFDFSGSECVTVDDADVFTFDDSGDNPFTLSAWICVVESTKLQTIISKWDEGVGVEWRFLLTLARKLKLALNNNAVIDPCNSDFLSQWKLNENAANTSVVDSVGTQNGVADANTTSLYSPSGKIESCFNMNSTHYVTVTDNVNYSFVSGGVDTEFTLAAWVYVTDTASHKVIISKYNISSDSLKEWELYLDTSERLVMLLNNDSTADYCLRTTTSALSTGWHLVAATYDATGGATAANGITLYVDGEVAASAATNDAQYEKMKDTATNVIIGGVMSGASVVYKFADKIDNVVIFARALPLYEILILYAGGSGTEVFSGVSPSATSDDELSLGWHFVAATYDSTGGATAANGITLYVDGVAVDSTVVNNADYASMSNTDSDVRIGAQYSEGDINQYVFSDKIDNVSIFNADLSASQVLELYEEFPYEITSPYASGDLADIQYAQQNDILYMVNQNYPPYKLSRYSHDYWSIDKVVFEHGPWLSMNDTSTTITPTGTLTTGGIVTLTSSSPIFYKGHEESIWKIDQKRGSNTFQGVIGSTGSTDPTYFFTGTFSFITTGTFTGTITLERSENGTDWTAALTPLTDRNYENPGESEDDGAYYRVTASGSWTGTLNWTITISDNYNHGTVKVDPAGYRSGTVVTGTVIDPLYAESATNQWYEPCFSDYRGFPRAISFYQQRLILAGTSYQPTTIWASKSFDYENFDTGTGQDNQAINYNITIAKQNPILWIYDLDTLLVGTNGGIFKWGALGQGEALTPSNASTRRLSGYGVDPIQPSFIAESLLFVERGGHKINEIAYQLESDGYVASDLTLLATHLFDGKSITETTVQARPIPVIWATRDDGTLLSLSFQKKQGIIAWARHITDGLVESVCVIPGTDEDEVWLVVGRTINSSTIYYIERMKPQNWGTDANDCWFVDSGSKYGDDAAETPATTITGLTWLANETVQVFKGDSYETGTVDPNGNLTISESIGYPNSECTIGLPYTSILTTMPLEIQEQTGFTIGRTKRVISMFVAFQDTMKFEYTDSYGTYWPVTFEDRTDILTPTTGYRPMLNFTGKSNYQIDITLREQYPYPMNILAIYPRVQYAQ